MKVVTSKGEHSLRWQYETCNKQVRKGNGTETVPQDCTSCIITDVEDEEVANVKITRWFKDSKNKPLARRQTFEMAIKGFNKEDRRAFWDVFAANVKRDENDKRFRKKKEEVVN